MRKLSYLYPSILLFISCRNTAPLEQEIKHLQGENNELTHKLTLLDREYKDLKSAYDGLLEKHQIVNTIKDTLQLQLNKQAELEVIRKKAIESPLSLPSFTIQNQTDKGLLINAKSPFKKNTVRYLSFKKEAVNNRHKIGQSLVGTLYAVYRLGSLVQRMANTGTFVGQDGKKYVYTNAWTVSSNTPSVILDKGIGDKTRGIFEKGKWTVELWFELVNSKSAYKLSESSFEIN